MSEPLCCWVNGREGGEIPATDRGLHYGDGVFETMAVIEGRIRLMASHLARLSQGLVALAIPSPAGVDWEAELAAAARGVSHGILKLIVTRGSGGRGYGPPSPPRPQRLLFLYPWTHGIERGAREGVRVRWCKTPLPIDPVLSGIKHLNRLPQVLARSEWHDPEIAEGLLCDPEGWVVEGTASNLFLVRDGMLCTPRLDRCGVRGVMRGEIIRLARELSIPLREERITRMAVEEADELFLCNAVWGIWPVRCLGDRVYPAPGPHTRRLQEALES